MKRRAAAIGGGQSPYVTSVSGSSSQCPAYPLASDVIEVFLCFLDPLSILTLTRLETTDGIVFENPADDIWFCEQGDD